MYDDQFQSLVKSEIKQKFLFCISMKVQSSAFYKSLSLQTSIRICSIYDFLCACFVLYCGKHALKEYIFVILCIFFGIMSINNSVNLSKNFSKYYYFWRICILILLPLYELFDYNSNKMCYYTACPNFASYLGFSLGITIVNFYFAKIAWSFNSRLQRGQELLVIHGKYLEQMMANENKKISDTQKVMMCTPTNYSQIEIGTINSDEGEEDLKKTGSLIPSSYEEKGN